MLSAAGGCLGSQQIQWDQVKVPPWQKPRSPFRGMVGGLRAQGGMAAGTRADP